MIQVEARETLQRRFKEFDIECVDVLIGKPDTAEAGGKIETLLEQLRIRQLSIEQLETYERQRTGAEKLRTLKEAEALAAKQAELTNSQVQIRIAENQGDADLARARKQAQQQIVMAEADLERSRRQAEQMVVTAKAESRAAHAGRQGREPADAADRLVRGVGPDAEDRLLRRPAAVRAGAGGRAPEQEPAAAGPAAHVRRRRRRRPTADGQRPAAAARACSARSSACWSPRSPASSSPRRQRQRPPPPRARPWAR